MRKGGRLQKMTKLKSHRCKLKKGGRLQLRNRRYSGKLIEQQLKKVDDMDRNDLLEENKGRKNQKDV